MDVKFSSFSEFARCTGGETCIPFQDCEPLKRLTAAGRLSPEQANLLRSKQCDSRNRVAFVCCGSGSYSNTPAKPKLPKAPECGTLLGNRVNFIITND